MPSPILKLDSNHNLIQDSYNDQTYRAAYDGSNNLEYEGWAVPGTAEGTRAWKIRKRAYSTTYLTSIKYPEISSKASSDYSFSWTDKATYTYS